MDNDKIIDGTYEILAELGKGAQGTIYKVSELNSGRILSLKTIKLPKNKQIDNDAFKESIKAEFKIIKNLEHPNIIRVYDFGFDVAQQKYYFTMEFLDGCNISKFLKSDSDSDLFIELTYQCLLGLNYLHANNIIHFDIKPDNIFVVTQPDGKIVVKILDFGLSELKTEEFNLKAKGTLVFMAPEIFIDHTRIGHQIDLYSLGISLLHSLFDKNDLYSLSSIISSQEVVKSLSNTHLENEELLSKMPNRKIARFLSQLIEPNPDIRLSSAADAIIAMNRIFNKNYCLPLTNHATTLENNTKFLIRDEVIDQLMIANETCKTHLGSTIFIQGDSGAGKTKIVQRLNYILSLKLQKIVKAEPENTNPNFGELAKSICEKINSLYHGLTDIHKEYAYLNGLVCGTENYQLLFTDGLIRMIKFASEKSVPTIIIEDFETLQLDARKLIQKLMGLTKTCQLLLIITISSDKISSESLESYRVLSTDLGVKKIKLEPLLQKEVELLEKELLGDIDNKPQDLINNILAFSQGNFRKTLQIYDYLIDKEVIKKVSDKYYFNTKIKYHELLSSDFSHFMQNAFQQLSDKDIRALALLTASYFKLDISEMVRILDTNLYELRKHMQILTDKRLVKAFSSHNEEFYLLESEEIKDFVLSKISDQDLWYFYHELWLVKLSKSAIAEHLNKLCKLLFEENFADDTDLTKVFKDLNTHDTNNRLYYTILNFIRLTKDKEFRFRLEIELFAFYYDRSREKCPEMLKKLNLAFRSIRKTANKIAFILFKFNYAIDNNLIKLNIKKILETEFQFLSENLPFEEFFTEVNSLIFIISKQPNKKRAAYAIFNKLSDYIASHENLPSIYSVTIKEMEIRLNFIEGDLNTLVNLAKKIRSLPEEQKIIDQYFEVIYSFCDTMEQILAYGSSDWEIFEDIFKESVKSALLTRKRDHMQTALEAAAQFYYSSSQYDKSYSYYNKLFEFLKKNNLSINLKVYADYASLKYYLYYPVQEVLEVYSAMKEQLKESTSLNNYIVISFNEIFVFYKSGNFSKARETVLTGFANYKYLPDDFNEDQFRRASQFFPDIFWHREIDFEVKQSYKNGNISKHTYNKFMEYIEAAYKEHLWTRFHHEDYISKLDGKMNEATPILIMEYIKNERKLPPANIVMQEVHQQFTDKNIYGSYLAYTISQFMLTNDEKLIKIILETAKKLYIHGYLLPVFYSLMPVIEFCLYTKAPVSRFKSLIRLYQDVEEQLFSSLDADLAAIFKKNHVYKTGVKVLERLSQKGKQE